MSRLLTLGVLSQQAYLPETIALINRMSAKPTSERAILINSVIKALKDNNLWPKIDVLRVRAAHDHQATMLNWKGDFANATTVNNPIFDLDRGVRGIVNNSYYESNFNPSSGNYKFTKDNSMLLVYNNLNGTTSYFINSVTAVGSSRMYHNGAAMYGTLTALSTVNANDANTNKLGFRWIRRPNSAQLQFGTDLTPNNLFSRASAPIPNQSFTEVNGPVRQAICMYSEYFNDNEMSAFQAIMLNYLSQIGAAL